MKQMFIAIVASISFISCQKDVIKNLSEEESRIYITNRDSSADFTTYKTISIVDSVLVIENNQALGKALTDYDARVIAAIKAVLQQRGFQLVDRASNPDLGVTVSRVYNTTTVLNYPSYWDSYGGYYDPSYWGYGGYSYYDPLYYGPSYYDYYQVTQGALTIDVLDLKNAKNTNSIRPVWSAVARGGDLFNPNKAEQFINALFEQSPYLKTN
jgi:hypothetical protein